MKLSYEVKRYDPSKYYPNGKIHTFYLRMDAEDEKDKQELTDIFLCLENANIRNFYSDFDNTTCSYIKIGLE